MPGVDEWGDFPEDLVEDGVKIAELLDVGDSFVYEYDYGDNWQHLVVLEAISLVGCLFRYFWGRVAVILETSDGNSGDS